MTVTQVALRPSEGSTKAGRPALTPELLAASGARYSRNNEGLAAILARLDPSDLEKSVDSIFRMVDYGHASIADMVPVAMFMDGISIWLAYYVWTLCPLAGGQESSTRYLKLSAEALIPPEQLGIPAGLSAQWRSLMGNCFEAYHAALKTWEQVAAKNPAAMGIPSVPIDLGTGSSVRLGPTGLSPVNGGTGVSPVNAGAEASEAARKKVARLRRNYAFDRARYFLPAAAATNVMLIMSARGWVTLCQHLLSHPLPEPRRLGEAIRRELALAAPRLIKHAQSTEENRRALADEFEQLVALARCGAPRWEEPAADAGTGGIPFLEVMPPSAVRPEDTAKDLAWHAHRYAPIGAGLQRISVRFGWSALGFAEIRDLNRHRTGTKYCPLVPQGFYYALDQVPPPAPDTQAWRTTLAQQGQVGRAVSARAHRLLQEAEASYVYWSLLGTEFPFEHTTTADKFIYEAELRTGLGAHFRYAKHLSDVLALWYEKFPATRGLILEGGAEPE